MASEYFRETVAGQLIRALSKNKFLKHPEERPDFILPDSLKSQTSGVEGDKTLVNTPHNLTPIGTREREIKSSNASEEEKRIVGGNSEKRIIENPILGTRIEVPPGIILVEWYDDKGKFYIKPW